MSAKPLKSCTFTKGGVTHYVRIQRTGDKMPQPARIVVDKEYWEDVGGVKGWETVPIYDRIFEDWEYVFAIYDKIVSLADVGSVKRR